jgi:hypothetical protein
LPVRVQGSELLRMPLHVAAPVQRVGIGARGWVRHQSVFCGHASASGTTLSPCLLIVSRPSTEIESFRQSRSPALPSPPARPSPLPSAPSSDMPALTRRRDSEANQKTWLINYDDIRVRQHQPARWRAGRQGLMELKCGLVEARRRIDHAMERGP